MNDFKLAENLLCPGCNQEKAIAGIWHKDHMIGYLCAYCQPPLSLVYKFLPEDKITREFIQNALNDTWQKWIELKKHMEKEK